MLLMTIYSVERNLVNASKQSLIVFTITVYKYSFVFRCGGLMVNNCISLIAAVFLGFSKLANSFIMIIIGRVFIGIFAGVMFN